MDSYQKTWFTIVLCAAAVVVAAIAFFLMAEPGNQDFYDAQEGSGSPQVGDRAVLSQESCDASGGTWNPCGSACRTDPDAICIELCVEYCECVSDDQCPTGYACGDFVEGVGVCL